MSNDPFAEDDEYDPESELYDPDSDSVTIPRVDTEDAGGGLLADVRNELGDEAIDLPDPEPTVDTSDVPAELQRTFWALVLVVNGAVLAFALGAMFVVFEGNWDVGGPLLAGGGILAAFAVRRYRTFDATRADG